MRIDRILPTDDVTVYVANHAPFVLRSSESEWPDVPGAVAHYLLGVRVDGKPAFAAGPAPETESKVRKR